MVQRRSVVSTAFDYEDYAAPDEFLLAAATQNLRQTDRNPCGP
jgi:hypothetical protein